METTDLKVTEKELKVLNGIIFNDYVDFDTDNPVHPNDYEELQTWMWAAQESSGLSGKSFSGVCSSLEKKKMIVTDTEGSKTTEGMEIRDTWGITLLKKGYEAWLNELRKKDKLFEEPKKSNSEKLTLNQIKKMSEENFNDLLEKTVLTKGDYYLDKLENGQYLVSHAETPKILCDDYEEGCHYFSVESNKNDAKQKGKESKMTTTTKAKKKSEKTPKEKGVIATIVALIENANKAGISKEQILNILVKTFPDRNKNSMKNTINVQVPNRISKERFKVKKLENGNYKKA